MVVVIEKEEEEDVVYERQRFWGGLRICMYTEIKGHFQMSVLSYSGYQGSNSGPHDFLARASYQLSCLRDSSSNLRQPVSLESP